MSAVRNVIAVCIVLLGIFFMKNDFGLIGIVIILVGAALIKRG